MSVQLKEPGRGWANAELLGGMLWGYGFLVGFFGLVVHPLFHPLPGLTHFSLSCQRKVSKRKARPRWRLPLEFMSQRGEGKNSLRSDSFPSFFLSATEIQGAI
jgi:hypothetical protein